MDLEEALAKKCLYELLGSMDMVLAEDGAVLRESHVFSVPLSAQPDFDAYKSVMDVSGLRREYECDVQNAMEHELGVSTPADVEAKLRRIRALLLKLLEDTETYSHIAELKSVYEARLRMYAESMEECQALSEQCIMDEVDFEDVICSDEE